MMHLKTTLLATLLLSSTTLLAQWECPSRIGGNLKPFSSELPNLTWATELTSSMGYAGDDYISNIMAFGAIDLSFNKFTLYAEGGLKRWKRFDGSGYENFATNFGMREAFLQYRGTNQTLNLGLRSTQGDDFYLLNERVIGIDFKQTLGNWNLRALTGTVTNRFARNGTFCTLGYLYNIVPGRERILLGRTPGLTNLAMLTLTYRPGSKPSTSDEFSTSSDEFSSTSNEFSSTTTNTTNEFTSTSTTTSTTNEFSNSSNGLNAVSDEFSSSTTPKTAPFNLITAGALAYTEYGNLIATKALITGLYAEVELAGITLKPEILLQSATANHALLWNLTAQKQITWSNQHQTKIFARYIGIIKLDSTAQALNSFSNVFAGEVLRLDAIELPLFQCGIKHSIPSLKASLKLQAALQTGETRGYVHNIMLPPPTVSRMEEYDLVLSKNLGNHLLINTHIGYLVYPRMTSVYNYETRKTPWGKIEMRYTF